MKISLYLFFVLILIASAFGYSINGNSVSVNDTNIYLSADPHTLTQNGEVDINLVSKSFTGNIDVAFGFNLSQTKPRYLLVEINRTKPNTTTTELIFINVANQSIIDYNYDGKTKWFVFQNLNVVAGKVYRAKLYLDVLDSGKYDIALKPSSETISQAIANNHFYLLDPWYNQTNQYNNVNLEQNLISYWSFDNNNLNDSKFTNHMTNFGTTNTTGLINSARLLTASSSQYMNKTNGNLSVTNSFTLSFWMRPVSEPTAADHMTLFTYGGLGSNNFAIQWTTTKKLKIVYNGATDIYECSASVSWTGTYKHIVIVMTAGTPDKTYVNNVSTNCARTSGAGAFSISGNKDITWGQVNNEQFFDGSIDEAGLWNIPLNSANISEIYNNGFGISYRVATPMQIDFNNKVPSDITSNNILFNFLNISYNITSNSVITTTDLFYNTSGGCRYVLGVAYCGTFNRTANYNISKTFTWLLGENSVYLSAIYNFDNELMRNYTRLSSQLTANNVLQTNISNFSSANYMFLEFMANTTTTNPLIIRACNSSWQTGNSLTSTNCQIVSQFSATATYNHCHPSSTMCHNYVTLNNMTIGKTSLMRFSFEGTGWNYYYIANQTNTARISANNGNTYTALNGTLADVHIHLFNGTEIFNFYACANDTANNYLCSGTSSDNIDITALRPTSFNVVSPTENASFKDSLINVNWSNSFSSTGAISYYGVVLLDSNYGFLNTIVANNGLNTNVSFNSSLYANGDRYIAVTSYDNQSLSTTSYSERFSINNTALIVPISTADSITDASNKGLFIALLFLGILCYFLSFLTGLDGSLILKLFAFFFMGISGLYVPRYEFSYGIIIFCFLIMIHTLLVIINSATGDMSGRITK